MSDVARGAASKPRSDPPPEKSRAAAPAPPPPAEAAPPSEDTELRVPARPARLNLRALATMAPPAAAERDEQPPADRRALDVDADNPFVLLERLLERVRPLVKTDDPFPWDELTSIVDRLVSASTASAELFWLAHAAMPPAGGDPIAFHQARVATLALRIGANHGLEPAQLAELGTAAALLDVGLWLLDGAARRDMQSPEYRSHPRLSAELVHRWGPPSDVVVQAILQHHELEHGQGFPRALQRQAIHPYAKVLGLVDRYATLTGLGRTRARPHEVIRDIVRSKNEEFSPALVKALLFEISIFPPGTPIRLNTGEIGRVTGVNRNHPLRPRVELVADGKGQALPAPRGVDLSETPFLYITGPVTESR
ncbi:MAG: HD domain-containing protein [Candidatus Rokubacteria bacterium]|nr:HD domain-containing protein [Candidatus Rokubacteria bacterium]